jgi:drug/metabolite transporter (DMT)-like permease
VPVLLGLLGVLAFSFTLPATRVAVEELDPTFVGIGREALAAVLAGAILIAARAPLPTRPQLVRLAIVASGVTIGWPIFTAFALRGLTSAHSAVIVGVLAFAATQGAGVSTGDVQILIAVALAAIGYAEGGALSRELGGWRVICWAVFLSAPLTVPIGAVAAATGDIHAGTDAWLGFAYVTAISALLGFFPWYAGLARGGVAKIGQIQLLQPLLTLAWSALLLGEQIGAATLVASIAVLASVVATQRTRVARSSRPPLVTSGR